MPMSTLSSWRLVNLPADVQGSLQDSTQSLETPAFPFDVTTQDALYARSKTWEEFDDLILEVELALRETGIRDVPKRELHDAALRVLTNHPEDLVDAVVEARR